MSFGFSLGDFLLLIDLARKTRRSFIEAPAQFRHISDEVKTLSSILQGLEDVLAEPEFPDDLLKPLQQHARACTSLLEEIQSVLAKYSAIDDGGPRTRRTWKRLKWEPDDIKDLRHRLSSNIGLLNSISDLINRHSVSEIRHGIDRLSCFHMDEEFTKIASWISGMHIAAMHNDVLAQRHSGTGKWFLSSRAYSDWLESSSGTLVCPGLPGGGKTMIVASVIEDLWNKFEADPEVGIAFIYCNYKRQHEQDLENCLASLLKQLLQQLRRIPHGVLSLYNRHTSRMTRPSVDELTTVLRSIIGNYSQVYLVVDALDEYSKASGNLTRFLSTVTQLQSGSNISLLATSRPNISEIKRFFEGKPELEISAKEEDVRRVLEHAMPGMPTCISNNPELQALVIDEITKAVDGMFLLARLHLESLRDKLRRKHVIEALKTLPQGKDALDAAYKEAIERIDSQQAGCRELAKSTLTWISQGSRPLTTTELLHALAVELDETELDNGNVPELEDIVSFCEGLVIIDERSNIISLVHYTTQEYLDHIKDAWMPNAQKEIALVCLAYLSFDAFSTGGCDHDKAFEDRLHENVLLDYCAKNWGSHVRDADDREVDEAALEFLGDGMKMATAVQVRMVSGYHFAGYSVKVPTRIGAIHIAAQFGLTKVMALLLAEGCKPDVEDDFGRTPLSYAAEYGHNDTVEFLTRRGDTDPDCSDSQGRTPLSWAAGGGHVDVMRTLLGRPHVSVNSQHANSKSPLSWAAGNGCVGAVKLLLEQNEVDRESRDKSGQTPLSWAAYSGHLETVKMLAECPDVDADSKDDFSQTPLSWAARNGHLGVVLHLVGLPNVDADSRDEDDRTALTWACIHGHVAVAKALTSLPGVNADARDMHGQSPLSWAAREGHLDLVKYLMGREDVQVHATDKRGLTPMRWAAWNGYGDVGVILKSGKRRNGGQGEASRSQVANSHS